MSFPKGAPRPPGAGRKKGSVNKVTAELKDMILTALDQAHDGGGVEYLKEQAKANPTAFLSLVGKTLPMTVGGTGKDGKILHKVEVVIIDPAA